MEDVLDFLERYDELEKDAIEVLWEGLTHLERKLINSAVWASPDYVMEGKTLYRRKGSRKRDRVLSSRAKRAASKRKKKKQKRLKKASKVIGRMRKLKSRSKKGEEFDYLNENFGQYLVREAEENHEDSRGPIKLLVLAKNGIEGRERLEDLSRALHSELGVSTWIEEGPYGETLGDGQEPRDYGLFVSLHSYGPEELDSVRKSIEKLAKKKS